MLMSLKAFAQYNNEKLTSLLTGGNEKTWTVSGIISERPEKKMIFNKNNSVKIFDSKDQSQTKHWSLKSADQIRWFILIGEQNYELIVSYDKKGNEYIKLTHQSGKSGNDYQMKLNPVK
jgi:hypothetical protein